MGRQSSVQCCRQAAGQVQVQGAERGHADEQAELVHRDTDPGARPRPVPPGTRSSTRVISGLNAAANPGAGQGADEVQARSPVPPEAQHPGQAGHGRREQERSR